MYLCWISWFWTNIVEKLWPALVAVFLTQWATQRFNKMRKPKLEMIPEGVQPGNWGVLDKNTGIVQPGSPYHTWRIKVKQVKIPRYLARLIRNRDSALQCKADLTFYPSNSQPSFSMQGRWANTTQISYISPLDQLERVMYPDRISVGYNSSEPGVLDCIVKFDDDKNAAYGWNNEAYVRGGKNPRTKLGIGTYKVDVRLSGQNFPELTKRFHIVISEDWQGTSLTLAEDQPSA